MITRGRSVFAHFFLSVLNVVLGAAFAAVFPFILIIGAFATPPKRSTRKLPNRPAESPASSPLTLNKETKPG